jgi:hypothetical protein
MSIEAKHTKMFIFKGYDWTELYDFMCKKEAETDEEKATYIRNIAEKTAECLLKGDDPNTIISTDIFREWLKCHIVVHVQQPLCSTLPLLVGLQQIEDDVTFLKYFSLLLETLWH